MALQKGAFIVLLCCFWFHSGVATTLSVPVIAWNDDDKKLDVPSVTAGQTKEFNDAFGKYVEPLIKDNHLVLIFLQDELSVDDFSKYASSFTHFKKVLDGKKNIVLPSVSKGKESISELFSSTSEIEHVDSSNLNDWKYKALPDAKRQVIIFSLEPVSGSHPEGKAEIFKRNDLVMHRITKSMDNNELVNDFSVVFTAEDPSQKIANILLDESIDTGLASRHLLSAGVNDTKNYFNNTCVMMYVTSIKHRVKQNTTEFITAGGNWKVGGCGSPNVGCSISLKREGKFGQYANVTLLIEFVNNTQEWYCDKLVFSGHIDGEAQPFTETYSCGVNTSQFQSSVFNEVRAPIGMSFACHELTFSHGSAENATVLTLGGFQIQTSCESGPDNLLTRFSSAYHCVGFFTIEILTVIFITIILMIGLYVGIMMMMAIQVQERTDDPKGKTLTIAAAHHE